MGIGKRIKEARDALGLTQEQLAKAIGVTKGAVANYETGVSHPKEPVLYKLFYALKCDANFLFQDELAADNMKAPLAGKEGGIAITQKSPSPSEEGKGEQELPPNIMGQPGAFASRVREAMAIRGITVEQLASLTGIDADTVRATAAGEYHPKRIVARAYARALRVKVTWILGFSVPMDRNSYGGLSDDAVDLIDLYEMIPPEDRAGALKALQGFVSGS